MKQPLIFCCNSMDAFSRAHDFRHLQGSQIRFRSDITLQPGSQRFAEEKPKRAQKQCKRQQQELSSAGTRPLEGNEYKGRRENHGGRKIRPAARMNGKLTFASAQAGHCLLNRVTKVIAGNIAKDKEAGWIGMPSQNFIIITACQDLKRSMFQGVVAPCSKISREFENIHKFIIVFKPSRSTGAK